MKEHRPPAFGRQPPEEGSGNEPRPLFELGQVVGTPGALQALTEADKSPFEFLARHVTGDWGSLPEEDVQENKLAVERGHRVFSSYRLDTGVKVWVITEWDRSVTTVLLPQEY